MHGNHGRRSGESPPRVDARALRNTAARVALLYALLAAVWIVLSDQVIFRYVDKLPELLELELFKGLSFVAVTALLLYALLRRGLDRLHLAWTSEAESNARYRSLFENPHTAMLVIDPDSGAIEDANQAAQQFYGWTHAELCAMRIQEINCLTPDEITAEMRKATSEQRRYFEFTHRLADGTQCAVDVFSGPIQHDGRTRLFSIIHEPTELKEAMRKLAESQARAEATLAALRQSEARLQLFIEHAPAALAMFDREMCYLAFSRRWRDDYGLAGQELLGRSHYAIFPEIGATWKAVHQRGLAGEVIRADEDRFERADGSIQWLRWEVHPWRDSSGDVGGIVIFSEDISARKNAETALQQLNATLETRVAERTEGLNAVNRSLETFVYSVSHDLKAPLRGLDGYSRLLELEYADRLDGAAHQYIANIRAGVARMDELIAGLLDYSRMERRALHLQPFDAANLLREVLAERADEIAAQGVAISVDLPPLPVRVDIEGLRVTLRNLLDNALKFTRTVTQPRIEFGARLDADRILIWVRDNGIGFDMQYHARIFEMFQHLQRQEEYPGTGIGLALVSKAVQRMGGRVWAESAPGAGATFYLDLPADAEP